MTKSAPMPKLRTWPWIVMGSIGIIALFGGLGTWAATSQISGAIVAPGTLGVESKIKTVQHLEGGLVGKFFVRDGDYVKAGALLITLDDTTILANHDINLEHIHQLEASIARLKAERDDLPSINFPAGLLKKQNDPEIKALMQGQVSLFEVRHKGKRGQIKTLRQRIVQLKEQVKGLQLQHKAKQQQVQILKKSLVKKQAAANQGLISGDVMDNIRRQKAQLTGEVGDIYTRIAQTRGSGQEIEQNILQIDKEFREKVLSQLNDNQAKYSELREKEIAIKEQLRRVDIRAPQDGRIHNMSVVTIGAVISPAKSILQIIPDNDLLIVETRISPVDVDQVSIGQEAAIHLSAFDSRTTPVLTGKVSYISGTQVVDQQNGSSFFTVEINIPKEELQRLGKEQVLRPGMPAEAFIKTGDRTPLNYLLKPLLDQISHAFNER
ncbi:MAG: HlyD family type I secretion periplasmic adaptor subunit [Hyphomicrobiaceae bacterium]|nr:HlyD family type I secretion periplasmic adaptor subunit [Hyphomicrobiaceae bacterium]